MSAEAILRELIAIPSVNPMGRAADENCWETRLTQYLSERLASQGVSQARFEVEPGRANLVAWLRSSREDAPLVIWEAHQDTVPVEGMTVPPFAPTVVEGRLHGRGACDVKGGMAAMLSAFERLHGGRQPLPVSLVLAFSVNEEFGCAGARELASLWDGEESFPFTRSPDAVLVAEPTRLQVVAAHKGVVRWRCRTRGVAAHSSTPQLGRNAIYLMARAVAHLETYANEVLPTLTTHVRLGQPTLSVGLVEGGVSVNVVPESCWIEIDRRLLPGESPEDAWRHAIAYLESQGSVLEHDSPYIATPPLPDDANRDLIGRLQHAAKTHGVASEVESAAYCSDASHFAQWPTVVFGPGDIAQAHTHDEWIDLEQLRLAEEILATLVLGWEAED